MKPAMSCRICGSATNLIGSKYGKFAQRTFEIVRCPACAFAFVTDPWTEFEKIYSREYYEGRGADPLVDYVFELEHPDRTIRKYEWNGLLKVITTLLRRDHGFRWLDYGCGNGGLVRFGRLMPGMTIWGFEEGWIAGEARRSGIPILDRAALKAVEGSFDVVTEFEVMEHVIDPLETLRQIRSLLKPGGLFFCTTGNAATHRDRLLDWPYIVPEIRISFFEPATLGKALERTGFRVEYPGRVTGHFDVIQSRVLKNIHIQTAAVWQTFLPWRMMAPLIDSHVQFTHHPIGWAQ